MQPIGNVREKITGICRLAVVVHWQPINTFCQTQQSQLGDLPRPSSSGYALIVIATDGVVFIPYPGAVGARPQVWNGPLILDEASGFRAFMHSGRECVLAVPSQATPSGAFRGATSLRVSALLAVRTGIDDIIVLPARTFCHYEGRSICRIGITYIARRLRNSKRGAKYLLRRVKDTKRIQDSSLAPRDAVDACDKWDFYSDYPKIVSILGEEPVPSTLPPAPDSKTRGVRPDDDFQDDDQVINAAGDGDNRSDNDSGIEMQFVCSPVEGEHNSTSETSSCKRTGILRSSPECRWSVDEVITLMLLEAMELRRTEVQSDVQGKLTRSKGILRRMIVKLLRKMRIRD